MQVANGDSQSIGHVRGFRWRLQMQEPGYHLLHLLLLCPAVADHRGFDGEWRILRYFETVVRGSQHGHPAHVPQLERRLRVNRVEDVLDGNYPGLMQLDHPRELNKRS